MNIQFSFLVFFVTSSLTSGNRPVVLNFEKIINLQNQPAFEPTYAPCTYRADPFPDKLSIECGPLIPRAALITTGFARAKTNVTTHELVHIRLRIFNEIPTDLFGLRSNTRNIQISCPDTTFNVTINPTAFRSSRSTALQVSIEKCDLRQVDWSWLNNFNVLESLHLSSSSLVNLQTMPMLPSVTALYVLFCGDFVELHSPKQTPNLNRLQIDYSYNVSNEVLDGIVSAAAGPYGDTLEILSLVANQMTRIPSAIGSFTRLQSLHLEHNMIHTLPTGSLHLSSTALSNVWLSNNNLKTIQSGAFKG